MASTEIDRLFLSTTNRPHRLLPIAPSSFVSKAAPVVVFRPGPGSTPAYSTRVAGRDIGIHRSQDRREAGDLWHDVAISAVCS